MQFSNVKSIPNIYEHLMLECTLYSSSFYIKRRRETQSHSWAEKSWSSLNWQLTLELSPLAEHHFFKTI